MSCKPVSERTGAEGCWILSSTHVGKLSTGRVFWTMDRYATAKAAQANAQRGGTVVEALGQFWLFAVGQKAPPQPNGSRVAQIGPIPVKADEDYTAQYMEGIMSPGAVSRTHRHSGPEVFYTEAGESCLETPVGKRVGSRGNPLIAPEGEPMEVVATGQDTRRGIVLVLHSSSKPPTTVVTDWKSKGLCRAAGTP